jgi:hypothetical protein
VKKTTKTITKIKTKTIMERERELLKLFGTLKVQWKKKKI